MRMDKFYKFSVYVFEIKFFFIKKDFLLYILFILIEILKIVVIEVLL